MQYVKSAASAALLAVLATGMTAQTAVSAETIKLIAIDGYPIRSMWVREFSEFFIPEVNKRLAETGNYEIEWQESYGGSIVKPRGVLEGIKLGLGDIGVVTTAFHNDKLPMQAMAYVTPFTAADARIVSKAMDEVTRNTPEALAEFDEQNQVYIGNASVLDSYQLIGREPIRNLDDLKGKKLSSIGYNLRYIDNLGATGVRGALPEYYNLLQTGVIDMTMAWPEAAVTFKFYEVAPHMLKADIGSVVSKAVTVNKDTWARLPEEVQNVLKEVAVAYRDHVAEVAMSESAASYEEFKSQGGEIYELSQEDRQKWADEMPNIAMEWAADLEAAGKPGNAVLVEYMEKAKAAGAEPLRDWSAEATN